MSSKRKSKREKIVTKERVKKEKHSPTAPKEKNVSGTSTIQIKKDLVKTLALSVLAIGIVLVLYWD